MHYSHVSESTSTVTATATSTSTITTVTVSGVSQPELAAGQRQQGYFMGLLTTPHTPAELTEISSIYYQQDELRLLSDASVSDVSASQTDPFDALVTHITATFDDAHQERSTSSLSLSNEPSRSQESSQPVEDVAPIVREEPSPDPTAKWIIMSGDEKTPFQCGYQGCGKKYIRKSSLRKHLVLHTGDSRFICYFGDCAGTVYPDVRELTRHMREKHKFERPFRCELCNRRFKRLDHMKRHMEQVHFIKSNKRSPKRRGVSKSSSAATATITASTITMTSRISQPELAAGQHQQGSFADLSKTVHTPEPTPMPATYYQQDELGLLSDISVSDISSSQVDPFEILATHQSVTFEDQNQFQEQLDEFPLSFDELLRPVDDFDLMASEDPDDVNLSILPNKNDERISNRTTISIPEHEILPPNNDQFRQALTGIEPEAVGITGDPKLPSSQPQAHHRSETEKWIILTGDKKKSFMCGYEDCGRKYSKKRNLQTHLITHTGDSPYKRPETDKWIILTGDPKKPFKCGYEGCGRKYLKKGNLQTHFITHTGDSPYRCYMGECTGEVAFSRQNELTSHIRSEHTYTSERPHHCEVCGSQFIRLDHLRNHRRKVHSTENEKKLPKRKKK